MVEGCSSWGIGGWRSSGRWFGRLFEGFTNRGDRFRLVNMADRTIILLRWGSSRRIRLRHSPCLRGGSRGETVLGVSEVGRKQCTWDGSGDGTHIDAAMASAALLHDTSVNLQPRSSNIYSPSEANSRIIEWLEHRFDQAVQFVLPDFLRCGIFPQLCSWLLSPGSRLQWCFLEKQFFKVVCRVEVGLVAGRREYRGYLLTLQRCKINIGEEGVGSEALKAGGANPFGLVLLHKCAHCPQAGNSNGGVGDIVFRLRFPDRLA